MGKNGEREGERGGEGGEGGEEGGELVQPGIILLLFMREKIFK